MKIRRYAIAEFTEKIPRMAQWHMDLGTGVAVEIFDLQDTERVPLGTEKPEGPVLLTSRERDTHTFAMLCATTATEVQQMNHVEIRFDDEARLRAEDALRFMGASLAVLGQVPCQLWSPTPFIALEGQSAEERLILDRCLRIRLPPWKAFYPMAGPGLAFPLDLASPSLLDRRDGVLLLGAAVSAAHGIGKLHELFRLFEHAFAKAGRQLSGPLSQFLSSHPWDLGYTEQEVAGWVAELRDPATHADLARQSIFVIDHHVQDRLVRIEQAAFDVLFNKRRWQTPDPAREDRNALRCAITATGQLKQTSGARMNVLSGWDHFNAFPLRGRLQLPPAETLPTWGFKFATWHFNDADRAELRRHGATDV